jgi:hypothetical protein
VPTLIPDADASVSEVLPFVYPLLMEICEPRCVDEVEPMLRAPLAPILNVVAEAFAFGNQGLTADCAPRIAVLLFTEIAELM